MRIDLGWILVAAALLGGCGGLASDTNITVIMGCGARFDATASLYGGLVAATDPCGPVVNSHNSTSTSSSTIEKAGALAPKEK